MSKEKLNKSPKFKRTILNNYPSEIDIIESIRGHMEGLWEIQNQVHNNLKNISLKDRQILESFISKFQNETGTKYSSFYACKDDSNGLEIEKFAVTTAWEDARDQTVIKLGNLKNLRKRFITGKIGRKQL